MRQHVMANRRIRIAPPARSHSSCLSWFPGRCARNCGSPSEIAQKGKRARAGAGMFGGGGVIALNGVAAVLAAAIVALAMVLPA